MDICFQVTHLPWLTHTSFFKLSSLQNQNFFFNFNLIKTTTKQPCGWSTSPHPLCIKLITLCAYCPTGLLLVICLSSSIKMERPYRNRVMQFLIQWLVGGIHGGGVGERVEICLLSIKCQLTKYDNFIILNPVLLQKESLCKTMVKISQISQMFCFGYLSANPLPDLTQAN